MEATRVTRARAAKSAPGTASASSSATGLTAAARARAASTAATKAKIAAAAASTASRAAPTSNKRKTRADDTDNEDNGRATKVRGRMRKGTSTDESDTEMTTTTTTKRAKTMTLATRGRPKKTEPASKLTAAKPTRGRAATAAKAAPAKKATTAAAKRGLASVTGNSATTTTEPQPEPAQEKEDDEAPPPRKDGSKKVTFLSPEKENVDPVVPAREGKAGGSGTMRGRPVRGPASKTAAPRGRPKVAANARKNTDTDALSAQLTAQSLDTSEDELAPVQKKPLRGILKTPAKKRPSNSPIKAAVPSPAAEVEADLEAQEAEHRLCSDSDGDDEGSDGEEEVEEAHEEQVLAAPEAAIDTHEEVGEVRNVEEHVEEEEEQSTQEQIQLATQALRVDGNEWEDEKDEGEKLPALLSSPAKRIGPSPYQNSIKSPAKRGGIRLPALGEGDADSAANKPASFMQSPAKRSPFKMPSFSRQPEAETPSLPKSSLFSSPAKRPGSAIKSRTPAHHPSSDDDRMFVFGRRDQDSAKGKSSLFPNTIPLQDIEHDLMDDDSMLMLLDSDPVSEAENHVDDEQSPSSFKIPRKLRKKQRESSPMHRSESRVLFGATEEDDGMSLVKEDEDGMSLVKDDDKEGSSVDAALVTSASSINSIVSEKAHSSEPTEEESTTPKSKSPSSTPPKAREEPESDNEQYIDPIYARLLGSPSPFKGAKTPKESEVVKDDAQAARNKLNGPKIGFTPLTKQLNMWAGSPNKSEESREAAEALEKEQHEQETSTTTPETPTRNQYFETTIAARMAASPSLNMQMLAAIEADIAAKYDQTFPFDDVMVTDEDMDLVAEARELSMMDPVELDRMIAQHQQQHEEQMSHEYGDENEIPVDPALGGRLGAPTTPQRTTATRTVHTVSKVPLKPADDSTPSPQKKRRASRMSMSPAKQAPNDDAAIEAAMLVASPAKSEAGWVQQSPARAANSTLLRGAVVYVDVRTSEGADTSGVFVDLLEQMGAQCVSNWDWTPEGDVAPGITHVVFKDGARDTVDKVRKMGGVVQCVGVSWVLDCERQNEWLDETPYHLETNRRRKSNGSTISTPRNRRDSSIWMRSSPDDENDAEDLWSNSILTPVPATPAPDTVARYAARLDEDEEMVDAESPQPLGVQTCPPKPTFYVPAPQQVPNTPQPAPSGLVENGPRDTVLMRLMAARRKSLQFAPKVGSPLARSWK